MAVNRIMPKQLRCIIFVKLTAGVPTIISGRVREPSTKHGKIGLRIMADRLPRVLPYIVSAAFLNEKTTTTTGGF